MRAFSSILSSVLLCSMMISSNTPALSAPEAPLDVPSVEASIAPQNISSDIHKDCQTKQVRLQEAISKFGEMGVGVAPFQSQLNASKQLLSEGKASEAAGVLARLENNLVDQQNRYYSNKWQSWHNERALLARAFTKKQGNKASVSRSSQPAKSNNMSKTIGSVISKKDTKYKPIIYAIAR
ncbi:MAG: hypothetical protein K2X77_25820 [Candidatus Obscuribacterales bacterium]|nr:hypothetical protein [Candidatus Obscuribacterales bacterium]